ncbi:MAG: PadR family transcriptional regulator [Actinomycetaceae bacterium]|nr:PadR family transcriptional regulator [Actinomycetaceae bacterium]MDY6083417.1 PadR family transcriptional regulator [Actinomycetaceae bacterium]
MAVRDILLWLLDQEDASVYQLKAAFEEKTNHVWPMNIGQVYQTVQRLARDGLVKEVGEVAGAHPSVAFSITDKGRHALEDWQATPILPGRTDRDDLVMRLAVAANNGQDVTQMVQEQRVATFSELRSVTQYLAHLPEENLTAHLLAERQIFDLEALGRWLDHVETMIDAYIQHSATHVTASENHNNTTNTTEA